MCFTFHVSLLATLIQFFRHWPDLYFDSFGALFQRAEYFPERKSVRMRAQRGQGRGPVNVYYILRFSHGISQSRMRKDLKELIQIYYPPMVGFKLHIFLNYQYYNFSGSQNVIPYSYIWMYSSICTHPNVYHKVEDSITEPIGSLRNSDGPKSWILEQEATIGNFIDNMKNINCSLFNYHNGEIEKNAFINSCSVRTLSIFKPNLTVIGTKYETESSIEPE